jgi:hypothetical protein
MKERHFYSGFEDMIIGSFPVIGIVAAGGIFLA